MKLRMLAASEIVFLAVIISPIQAQNSANAQNQVSSAQSLPDVIAILESAKSKQVKLSGEEMSKYADSAYHGDTRSAKWDLKHCNQNNYDNGIATTSKLCGEIAQRLVSVIGPQDPQAEIAYQRACALEHKYLGPDLCYGLGSIYETRGDLDMALAVYEHAPNCKQAPGTIQSALDPAPCLRGAADVFKKRGDTEHERAAVEILCNQYSSPSACARFNQFGGSADVQAADAKMKARAQQAVQEAAEESRRMDERSASRAKERDEKFNAVMGAMQSLPGGSNPNAIQDTADHQAAAILAIGDANTAAQQGAQRQGGTQVQGTGDKFHCVGASGADSGYNNGCQLVQGTNSGTNGSSVGSTGGNSPAGVVGTTGNRGTSANSSNAGSTGTASHYVVPLSASCIRQFWDPKFYNWLSFQNNCGQAIHLSYAGGLSGATDDLGPGQATNTGWSQAEVTQKGVFSLYVCPAGYIPVDSSTDQVVNRPNQTFTCKQR